MAVNLTVSLAEKDELPTHSKHSGRYGECLDIYIPYPSLVAEIISPESTQRDREDKFQAYLKMPSLKYFLIVSQDKVRVELLGKMKEGQGWSFHYFESLEEVIPLDQIEVSLKVADMYDDVTLVSSANNTEDETIQN